MTVRDVTVSLLRLDCADRQEDGGDEPYLWVLMFKVDSSTLPAAALDAGTALTVEFVEGGWAPGDVRGDEPMFAGEADIPAATGTRTFRVSEWFPTLGDNIVGRFPGLVGVLVAVLEHDAMATGEVADGFRAFKAALQHELTTQLRGVLNGSFDDILGVDAAGNPVPPTGPVKLWRVQRLSDASVQSRLAVALTRAMVAPVVGPVTVAIAQAIVSRFDIAAAVDRDDFINADAVIYTADVLTEKPTYFLMQMIGDEARYKVSGSITASEVHEPDKGEFAKVFDESAYLYMVDWTGGLHWYRHTQSESGGDEGSWVYAPDLATDWTTNVQRMFPGSGDTFYRVRNDGTLTWYRHPGFNTGAHDLVGPKSVGIGWLGQQSVCSGGDRVVYTLDTDGVLSWYRHDDQDSGGDSSTWVGPVVLRRDWREVRQVFSTGDGILYAIRRDGTLWWYRHRAFASGGGPETVEGGALVGWGWADFRHVFSPGNGIVYTVTDAGDLLWRRHLGWQVGGDVTTWLAPKKIGHGWEYARHAFALMHRRQFIQ